MHEKNKRLLVGKSVWAQNDGHSFLNKMPPQPPLKEK